MVVSSNISESQLPQEKESISVKEGQRKILIFVPMILVIIECEMEMVDHSRFVVRKIIPQLFLANKIIYQIIEGNV